VQYVGTNLAPTRDRGTATTSSVRMTKPSFTVTRSPWRRSRAGFATWSFTSTEPARQASVANARVLNTRTAQSHLSSRALEPDASELSASENKATANV
jgi:hypothetical protein